MKTQEKEDHQNRISQLEGEIARLIDLKADHEKKLSELTSEFSRGDVVHWFDSIGQREFVGIVVEIKPWDLGRSYWIVRVVQSDGSIGGLHDIYHWQKPELYSK